MLLFWNFGYLVKAMNIHYPRTETNGRRPLYQIIPLMPCYVVYKILLTFTAISIIPFSGLDGAKDFWDDN
jgi:hypothetical protein